MCCISVIVPVYNSEKTLVRCVDSILSQTFSDFELLLVDDGSTDSSGKMCDDYALKDKRVHVFHKKNGGVSSARNVGLDNASGKWVTFCDSDDYVNGNWLQIYLSFCSRSVKLVMQSIKYIGVEIAEKFNDNKESTILDFIETFYSSSLLGYCFNKLFLLDVIRLYNVRFNEYLKYREDAVFVFQYLFHIDKVAYTDQIGYYYIVEDFYTKYSEAETFEPLYEIFLIVNRLYLSNTDERLYYKYYCKELFHALFDSFLKNDINSKNKLKRYQQFAFENNNILKSLSPKYSMILSFHTDVAYVILKLMAYIRRKL